MKTQHYRTPSERGDGYQTTTWDACIAWYEHLAADFAAVLHVFQIGPIASASGPMPATST